MLLVIVFLEEGKGNWLRTSAFIHKNISHTLYEAPNFASAQLIVRNWPIVTQLFVTPPGKCARVAMAMSDR